jgi:hypothetical protein
MPETCTILRSKPYLLLTNGQALQPTKIIVSCLYPLHFWGLTIDNELVDLGSTESGCIQVTATGTIIAVYYEFCKGNTSLPSVELIFGRAVNA